MQTHLVIVVSVFPTFSQGFPLDLVVIIGMIGIISTTHIYADSLERTDANQLKAQSYQFLVMHTRRV
jgi:hypothetical protein